MWSDHLAQAGLFVGSVRHWNNVEVCWRNVSSLQRQQRLRDAVAVPSALISLCDKFIPFAFKSSLLNSPLLDERDSNIRGSSSCWSSSFRIAAKSSTPIGVWYASFGNLTMLLNTDARVRMLLVMCHWLPHRHVARLQDQEQGLTDQKLLIHYPQLPRTRVSLSQKLRHHWHEKLLGKKKLNQGQWHCFRRGASTTPRKFWNETQKRQLHWTLNDTT